MMEHEASTAETANPPKNESRSVAIFVLFLVPILLLTMAAGYAVGLSQAAREQSPIDVVFQVRRVYRSGSLVEIDIRTNLPQGFPVGIDLYKKSDHIRFSSGVAISESHVWSRWATVGRDGFIRLNVQDESGSESGSPLPAGEYRIEIEDLLREKTDPNSTTLLKKVGGYQMRLLEGPHVSRGDEEEPTYVHWKEWIEIP